ncbi:colicin Ia central receptor-binding domain-containing protein, partial [Escherichia coli]
MPDNSVSASDIRRSKIVALTVTESLKTARNALTRAEQQLTQQKNTPDGKTIVSPEKFPGRSSTNHSIVVSGDPRFAGTIKITTSAVIDN